MGVSSFAFGQEYEYTFVFLNSKPDKVQLSEEESEALQKSHMANIDALASEGKILSAGPFEGGGGIFVLSTGSLKTAQTWLETDPAVKANRWNIEMFPFIVSKGKICEASEPYEMVTYQFVRFRAQNEIANYKTSAAANTTSDLAVIGQLQSQGNLLLDCSFANNEGGVIIYKGEDQSEKVNTDPLVSSGNLSITTKQLWIAKGSFCER